jgi:hypothetical protein
MRAFLSVAVAGVLMGSGLLAQQAAGSKTAARELIERLESQRLEAIAAADPQDSGRFIAALYIAPSQLLVVSGRHPARDALAYRIAQRQYRDTYLDLQATPGTEGKLFVHDLGADGLGITGSTSVDNVYESGVRVALTDGGSRERFARADAEYTRMLRVLLGAVAPSVAPPPSKAQLTAN